MASIKKRLNDLEKEAEIMVPNLEDLVEVTGIFQLVNKACGVEKDIARVFWPRERYESLIASIEKIYGHKDDGSPGTENNQLSKEA